MSRPGSTLQLCAALVGLQALGLAAVAVFYLVELVVATEDDPGRALVTIGLSLAAAVGLALVARGLLHGRRWARSPALVTNLSATLLLLPLLVPLGGTAILAALVGLNVGSGLTWTGSLANLLWRRGLDRLELPPSSWEFHRVSLVITPLALLAGVGTLALLG